jgi:hypothetical protein
LGADLHAVSGFQGMVYRYLFLEVSEKQSSTLPDGS